MKKQTLDQRLELYGNESGCKGVASNALLLGAGAVVGAGAVLIPPPAEAAIVYSGLQNKTVQNSATVYVDVDGVGGADFTFYHYGVTTNSQYFVRATGSVTFVGNTNGPSRLTKSELINDNGMFPSSVALLASDKGNYGNFLGNSGYLGVRFTFSGSTHYGWIQFKANADASIGTIIDWAYEDIPGRGIKAGDTGFNWNLFLPAIISGNKK